MTRQKSFKERIRARMDKTGESYTTARRQLIEKAESEARRARGPQTIAPTRKSDESVLERTGRTWDEWFALLDEWDATARTHTEIARWLVDEHGVAGWWAQTVTVTYEQERGMRAPGQRSDGSYGVSASKTIEAPVDALYEAFADEELRGRWLGDYEIDITTAHPAKTMRAAWEEGTTRLAIAFIPKGDSKSQVALEHEKIKDAAEANEMKAFWKERLGALKKVLEG